MKTNINNKYLLAFIISSKFQFSNKGLLLGRVILYSIVVYLFYQIFEIVDNSKYELWHVSFAQLISLALVPITFQLQQDFNNKQFEYYIIKPINFLFLRFTEAAGMTFTNYIVLLCNNIILCSILGKSYSNFLPLCLGIIYGIFSLFLFIVITLFIGLISYWVKDIKDIFYLNMTASFCFGGLVVPVELYPEFIKKISFFTPYPWILSAPVEIINGNISFNEALFNLATWFIIFISLIYLLSRKNIECYLDRGY